MISETAYDAMSAELQRLREENAEMRMSLIRVTEHTKVLMHRNRYRRRISITLMNLQSLVADIERRFIGAKEVA